MLVKIYDFKIGKEIAEPIKMRNNLKIGTIIDKIKDVLNEKYNAKISRFLPTGKVDFATGNSDIHYIIFGENLENLPTREIYFEKSIDKH